MAISYFGQRQVEIGALNASFEPVRSRLDGGADPQTPREPPKVRLHVPEAWVTLQSRKRAASPERAKSVPHQANKACVSSRNDDQGSSGSDQAQLEDCVLQAIYVTGFGNQLEKMEFVERQKSLTQLKQGFMAQMQAAFQAHGVAPSQQRAPAVKEVEASEVTSYTVPTGAATYPDLQLGQSPSRRQKYDQRRQPKMEASPPERPMFQHQQAPASVPGSPYPSSAVNAAPTKKFAQDHALQGASSAQNSQHQQHLHYQQVMRLQHAWQTRMRRMADAAQVRTWPEIPLLVEQKGGSGKGHNFPEEVSQTPTTQVSSMNSLPPWYSDNSQGRTATMSMDSLPHMAVERRNTGTRSLDSLPRMVVRSMDSLPHVAVGTMDSLPEITENSTEDDATLSCNSYQAVPSGSVQERTISSMASGSFAPQPRTWPNLPDFPESADPTLGVDPALCQIGQRRIMLDLEQNLETLNEVMRQMSGHGSQFSKASRQIVNRKPGLTPKQTSLQSAAASSSSSRSLPQSTSQPSSGTHVNRRALPPGLLPPSAGDTSFAGQRWPSVVPSPPKQTTDASHESPLPPLPFGLMGGEAPAISL